MPYHTPHQNRALCSNDSVQVFGRPRLKRSQKSLSVYLLRISHQCRREGSRRLSPDTKQSSNSEHRRECKDEAKRSKRLQPRPWSQIRGKDRSSMSSASSASLCLLDFVFRRCDFRVLPASSPAALPSRFLVGTFETGQAIGFTAFRCDLCVPFLHKSQSQYVYRAGSLRQ